MLFGSPFASPPPGEAWPATPTRQGRRSGGGVGGGWFAPSASPALDTPSSSLSAAARATEVAPPAVVLDFIECVGEAGLASAKRAHLGLGTLSRYVSRLVAAEHYLEALLPQIRLCASRLTLSSLPLALWDPIAERHADRDERFVRQQRWMRRLPPASLGVEIAERAAPPDAGQPPADAQTPPSADAPATSAAPSAEAPATASPFGPDGGRPIALLEEEEGAAGGAATHHPPPLAAASVLSDFCYLSVPVDMLLCLYRAIGLVHEAAAALGDVEAGDIGADQLLPLLVWTVVHAQLPHIFSALEYAKRLAAKELVTSELGYYLACLEAACCYVLDSTPEKVRRQSEVGATSPLPLEEGEEGEEGEGGGGLGRVELGAAETPHRTPERPRSAEASAEGVAEASAEPQPLAAQAGIQGESRPSADDPIESPPFAPSSPPRLMQDAKPGGGGQASGDGPAADACPEVAGSQAAGSRRASQGSASGGSRRASREFTHGFFGGPSPAGPIGASASAVSINSLGSVGSLPPLGRCAKGLPSPLPSRTPPLPNPHPPPPTHTHPF